MKRMTMTSDLNDPTFKSLKELVDSCVSFYENNLEKMRIDNVRKRRADLSVFVERFHRDCGTLTCDVKKRINDLKDGNCAVVMSAHQPNLFAYSGILRKATLISVLAKHLEERLNVPVVNFFGIADQDLTGDRWVKSALLPAVMRRDGLLSIHIKLPDELLLNKVFKPSLGLLGHWKTQIERWLEDAVNSVDRLCCTCGFSILNSEKEIKTFDDSFFRLLRL